MPTHHSDDEPRSERDSSPGCTLLDQYTLQGAIEHMKAHPCEVFTFDHDRKRLVQWPWPSNGANVAVEPQSLKNVLNRTGIPLPTCFCSHLDDDNVITNTARLLKKDGGWQFACRRLDGCGFLIKLDKFNPSLAILVDEKRLASYGKNFAFARAKWDDLDENAFDSPAASDAVKFASRGNVSCDILSKDVAGPSRTPKHLSRADKRPVPYTSNHQPKRATSPVSPPRMLIERDRRPYGLVDTRTPAPSASSAAVQPISAWEHIPAELLDIAYSVMTDGIPVTHFDALFIRCKCDKIVYRASHAKVHAPLCDSSSRP